MSTDSRPSYVLYIDDSGTRFPDRQNLDCRRDGMDHFALGGVLFLENEKQFITDTYLEFCRVWGIDYPLHSTKIRGMRDDFAWLEESAKGREKFYKELNEFVASLPVLGFAAVIHRPGYNARYEELYGDKRWWMCKTAYAILIERVCKYVDSQGGVLKVRFEGAGKKEDRALLSYASDLKKTGMPFSSANSEKYGALNAEDFSRIIISSPRRKMKENLFIQIADLVLYPMAKRGYDEGYKPWAVLYQNKKVIDAILNEQDWADRGIKYSCF